MRKWSGVFLVAAGIVYILGNSGILYISPSQVLLLAASCVFILLGAVWTWRGIFIFFRSLKRDRRHIGRFLMGGWLLTSGSLLALSQFGQNEVSAADFWKGSLLLLVIYTGFKLFIDQDRTKVVKFEKNHANRLSNIKKNEKINKKTHSNNSKSSLIGDITLGKEAWEVNGRDIKLGVGSIHLDFSKGELIHGENVLKVQCGIGSVEIELPAGTAVDITAQVKLGEVVVFGNKQSGPGQSIAYRSTSYETSSEKLLLYLETGLGDIKVREIG